MPVTMLGRWSVWMVTAFVVMFISNVFINVYVVRPASEPGFLVVYWLFVIFMLASGLAGGILGLTAVVKKHERSFLVWLAVFFGLFVLLLILNELLQGVQYFAGS